MEQATNIKTEPSHAGFKNLEAALDYRSSRGGWVFHTERGDALWFDPAHTPTTIFQHQATRGLSGKLH
ncbi:MAG: hypothetical protein CMK74_20435 [Pseudomonadales bacterium]|nr:hypothetical protein [Pseudomonadales bacterium]|tara:strand:+ start:12520 stop:12723 length:204 start_codon:yes stop_codon:yes gene_type:complete